jgi:hypothetical protein
MEFFDFMDSLGTVETLPEELNDYKQTLPDYGNV